MSIALPQKLNTLLSRSALASLSPSWHQALRHAANVTAAALSQLPEKNWSCLMEMVDELARLEADEATILAAILFDLPVLQETLVKESVWPSNQKSIMGLLDGQNAAARVWVLHAGRDAGKNSEGLRRLLLSIIHDVRVVPIILARQLALMRAAISQTESKQRALAQLTRDIHAPLANRLGIWQLKWELEDLAFRFLEPTLYRHIANALDERRIEREEYIHHVVSRLTQAFLEYGVSAQVSGRPKHIYSIWRKMQKKNLAFDQLYDLRAVRIIVLNESACYTALGIVHSMWAPVPSEFDDYIARPKVNQYRSLHTAVIGPEGRTVEIQIRTDEMHAQAELGLAAHWKYKEGGSSQTRGLERKIAWIRQLLETGGENEVNELAGALDAALVEERIYAVTPKGEVIDLPLGSTALDFAYYVHTMIGHRCRGAKVNDRIVPLTHRLKTGDRVEILTAREAKPRRDWLVSANAFLASSRSRDKVRAWFHKLDRTRNLQAGKDILTRELRRLNLMHADLSPVMEKLHLTGVDDLYMQLALGEIRPSQFGRAILESERPVQQSAPLQVSHRLPPSNPSQQKQTTFSVEGIGNLVVQLAQCCQPVAGETIIGYLTRTRGMTVHRPECEAFKRMALQAPNRVLPVEWGSSSDRYEVNVLVTAIDRRWLLKDITLAIAQEDASLSAIHSEVTRTMGHIRLALCLKVKDFGQLSTLLGKLDMLPGVVAVQRKGLQREAHSGSALS